MLRNALNGKLVDYDFNQLMNNVKERGESLFIELEHNNKMYYVSIHYEELFTSITDNTKWYFDIIEENEDGSEQKRISTNYTNSNLLDYEVVENLNAFKNDIIAKTKKSKKVGRRKVRNYQSVNTISQILNDYFEVNRDEVLNDLVSNTPFKTLKEVEAAERNSYWGLDCGWVYLATGNAIQYQEWIKDNGKYNAKVRGIAYPFNCQSVTLKQIQLRKAIKDLGFEGQYYSEVRLD